MPTLVNGPETYAVRKQERDGLDSGHHDEGAVGVLGVEEPRGKAGEYRRLP